MRRAYLDMCMRRMGGLARYSLKPLLKHKAYRLANFKSSQLHPKLRQERLGEVLSQSVEVASVFAKLDLCGPLQESAAI